MTVFQEKCNTPRYRIPFGNPPFAARFANYESGIPLFIACERKGFCGVFQFGVLKQP